MSDSLINEKDLYAIIFGKYHAKEISREEFHKLSFQSEENFEQDTLEIVTEGEVFDKNAKFYKVDEEIVKKYRISESDKGSLKIDGVLCVVGKVKDFVYETYKQEAGQTKVYREFWKYHILYLKQTNRTTCFCEITPEGHAKVDRYIEKYMKK